jgi:two-component system nitrate/nitrite response regulator NarL
MQLIRVVVADDDAAVREALSEVLEEDGRFAVVGAAETGDELNLLVDAHGPDIVLLDVRMPGGGPSAAEAVLSRSREGLQRDRPGTAPLVIAISAQTSTATVVAMLRAGAVSYLAKGRLGELPDMVARCAGGEVVLAVPSGAEALKQLMRTAAS